jgi:hypothetical protein
MFGPKKEQGTGGWRRLCNEELHSLYASPNIRLFKSRRMTWARHVAWASLSRRTLLHGVSSVEAQCIVMGMEVQSLFPL